MQDARRSCLRWPSVAGAHRISDFSLEETRNWWGRLNAEHVLSGLAGIWNDMNEPATGDVSPEEMWFERGKYPHARFHNQYAMLMAMATAQGLLAALPDRRTFVLSRAGSPGIQRYAANWMGDNCSRWEHLEMSVPMALGFGISGQPFVGADIGGFVEDGSMELLVRWYQCGTLTPFCRNHNCAGQRDQYPWVYGGAAEDLVRDAIAFRYRLMPYIYTQFMLSTQTGAPVQIPLVFQYQDDLSARYIDDEYLFGSDLLVAPIFRAGDTSRHVYLPAGTWHDWRSGEVISRQAMDFSFGSPFFDSDLRERRKRDPALARSATFEHGIFSRPHRAARFSSGGRRGNNLTSP